MRHARTYRWTRMRPYRARFRGQGVFFAFQSWAGCITNIFGFDLRQAQAAHPMVWSDRASDGRMDRQSAHSGAWLGANPSLPDPGPRWRIRRNIHTPSSIDRHSRSSDI